MSSHYNSHNSPEKRRVHRKRKLKIWNLLFVLIVSSIIVGTAIVSVTVFSVIKNAPKIDPTQINDMLDQSTFIYDYAGNLIEKISFGSYRVVVPLEDIPKSMQDAIVSIEDERFFSHKGVDIKRVGGALIEDIKTMSFKQGASTLTMQLAKNLYTSFDRKLTRKIKDIYYAVYIEKQLSKSEILAAYLNIADFGHNIKGVEAAANTFFNKKAKDLTLAESAMLAGVPQRPVTYSPYITEKILPEDSISKLQIIPILNTQGKYKPTEQELSYYHQALSLGKIDRYMFMQLKNGDYYLRKAVLNDKSVQRQHVVLKKMLELNRITQADYEQAINEPIKISIGKRRVTGISSYFTDVLKNEVIKELISDGYTREEADRLFSDGGLRIYSTLNMDLQKILERKLNDNNNFLSTFVDEDGIIQPQVSMVIIHQNSGQVRALIGGRGIGGRRIFNRALSPRQPGSAIKPIAVYAAALKNGMTAATIFNDSPRYDETLGKYWPKNSTGYMGKTTMRNLLIRSSNVGAVEVGGSLIPTSKYASIQEMISTLKDFGITSVVTYNDNPTHNDENLSLCLGGMTRGISPLELTAAYAAVADLGKYTKPVFFTRIESSNGKVILNNKPVQRQVLDPTDAYILQNMLYGVVNSTSPRGTGLAARLNHINTAGKTGTTTDKKDAWFIGMTPYYTAGLWIGTDKPTPLAQGSIMAAKLWKSVMDEIHEDRENIPFPRPADIVETKVSPTTGLLYDGGYNEFFKPGTEPTQQTNEEPPKPVTQENLYDEDGNIIELLPNNEKPVNPKKNTEEPKPSATQSTTEENPTESDITKMPAQNTEDTDNTPTAPVPQDEIPKPIL